MSRVRTSRAERAAARAMVLERIALATTATILTIAVLELVARTQTPAGVTWSIWEVSSDATLGVEPARGRVLEFDGFMVEIPSTEIAISEQGFRSPPIAAEKPAGVRRLVCLGDSVTFGWGVSAQDAVCPQLARQLGPEWEAVNLGVPGYNAQQSVRRFELRGLGLDPDAVVLVLNSNDFDPPITADAAEMPSWWFRHSALVRWVTVRLRARSAAGQSPAPTGPATATAEGLAALDRLATLCRGLRAPLAIEATFPADATLLAALGRTGATVVSAPDVLRRPERIIPGDGHPNVQGHAELADRLAIVLEPRFKPAP